MAKLKIKNIYGDNTPLFLKMLLIFVAFSLVVISLFWALGFAISGVVFKSIRINEAHEIADLIAQNIDNADLSLLVKRLSFENDACIIVSDKNGNVYLSQEVREDCSIHAFTEVSLEGYYDKARDGMGYYSEEMELFPFDDNYDNTSYEGKVPRGDEEIKQYYIYTLIAKNSAGENYAILVDTVISPSEAYTETLVIIFVIVSVLTAILAGYLSYRLSNQISGPIIELTSQAKEISSGSADLQITGSGYKEILELRDSLQLAQKEVNEVEHYRRELIANVSHDLRTPLTLIKGYTELMRDIPSEATAENFQVVIDETARLTNLVNDMLSLSKEQEGNEELNLSRFDLVEVMDALIVRHGKLIEHLGYTLEWEHVDKAFVYADETKITQVVYNLINNAVNYAGEDKKVIVKVFVRGGVVRVEVIDHGDGVDVEVLPHIWDRYYKSEKSHRRSTVGTGLGLSIVKSVMSKHPGGAYGVITSVGEGSTFYIELQRA